MEQVKSFESSEVSPVSSPASSLVSGGSKKTKPRKHEQRKRKPVGGKKTQPKSKRAYRKKLPVKPSAGKPSPAPSFTETETDSGESEESDQGEDVDVGPSNSMCSFRTCLAEYGEGERWVKCDYCENWACPKCSRTEKLSSKLVKKIYFKCEKCRSKISPM